MCSGSTRFRLPGAACSAQEPAAPDPSSAATSAPNSDSITSTGRALPSWLTVTANESSAPRPNPGGGAALRPRSRPAIATLAHLDGARDPLFRLAAHDQRRSPAYNASAAAGSTPAGSRARYSASAITRPSARSLGPTRDAPVNATPSSVTRLRSRSSSSGVGSSSSRTSMISPSDGIPRPSAGPNEQIGLGVKPDRVIDLEAGAPEDARQVAHQIEVPQVRDAPELRVPQAVSVRPPCAARGGGRVGSCADRGVAAGRAAPRRPWRWQRRSRRSCAAGRRASRPSSRRGRRRCRSRSR